MADGSRTVEGGIYHLLVGGAPAGGRLDGLGDCVVSPQENGGTRLVGPIADQAAVHSLLRQIAASGLPLLMAVRAECPCRKKKCPRRGLCTECHAYHVAKGKLPYCLRRGTWWDKAVRVFG